MTQLTGSKVSEIRRDLELALRSVTAKHGLDFSVGCILFGYDNMRCKIEGVVRQSGDVPSNPKELALTKMGGNLLGCAFDSDKIYNSQTLGQVKIVGYNESARKFPFIVQQLNTSKRYKVTALSARNMVAGAV